MLNTLFAKNPDFFKELQIRVAEDDFFKKFVDNYLLSTPQGNQDLSIHLSRNNELFFVHYNEQTDFIIAYPDNERKANIFIGQEPLESLIYLSRGNLKSKFNCPLIRQNFEIEHREFAFKGVGLIEKLMSEGSSKIYEADFGIWKPLLGQEAKISTEYFAVEIDQENSFSHLEMNIVENEKKLSLQFFCCDKNPNNNFAINFEIENKFLYLVVVSDKKEELTENFKKQSIRDILNDFVTFFSSEFLKKEVDFDAIFKEIDFDKAVVKNFSHEEYEFLEKVNQREVRVDSPFGKISKGAVQADPAYIHPSIDKIKILEKKGQILSTPANASPENQNSDESKSQLSSKPKGKIWPWQHEAKTLEKPAKQGHQKS